MSGHSIEGAEPNLTPMLDMVFQLITFFMLVINFKGASMDLSLKLPVLGSARPMEYKGVYEQITLNVNAKGGVRNLGKDIDIEEFMAKEANFLKFQLKSAGKPVKDEEGLPVPIVIRADRSVTFEQLNDVIEICQKNGYRQFALSAKTGEEVK